MKYVWDENKNEVNKRKHGVDFLEAQTVFEDVESIEIYDDLYELDEERFIIIGHSNNKKILTVVYAIRIKGLVRIISARKATRKEVNLYYRRS